MEREYLKTAAMTYSNNEAVMMMKYDQFGDQYHTAPYSADSSMTTERMLTATSTCIMVTMVTRARQKSSMVSMVTNSQLSYSGYIVPNIWRYARKYFGGRRSRGRTNA